MGQFYIQNDFSHGELDPRLLSRTDVSLYHKTALQLRNVVVLPQGGARRRFGSIYAATISANTDQYQIKPFIYAEGTSYVLVFTDLVLNIYKKSDNSLVATKVTPWLAADVSSLRVAQTFNQMVIVHPSYQPYELKRGADDATWTLNTITFKTFPAYDFKRNYDAITFTLAAPSYNTNTTLTTNAALFDASYVGGLFIAEGAGDDFEVQPGVARITAFNSPTSVDVHIVSAFSSTIYLGTNSFLGQPAWSSTAGWPQTVTFYEGRLWFGGAKSLPETNFGSVSNDYYNFDVGTGQDDDALQATIATSSINFIKALVSSETLQIFTGSGAFLPPQLDESPLTPTNLSIRRQPSSGVNDVEPVIIDNRTVYIAKGGKRVLGFEPASDNGVRYESPDIGLVSSHLIRNPVDMAVLSGSDDDDASYLFLVNGDGTLAIYQSLEEQNVSAWTLQTTNGNYKKVCAVEDVIYTIVERTVNNTTVQYLEYFSFGAYTDSAKQEVSITPITNITGLDHLEGEEVRIRADGFVLQTRTVVGGEITIERASLHIEVGLNFNCTIEPVPVDVLTQIGPTLYLPKRINRIFIDYYQSLGVYLNGTLIPYLEFGDMVLDQPPEIKSGIYEFPNIGLDGKGWDQRQSCVITQQDPLDMTIIGVGYEITV